MESLQTSQTGFGTTDVLDRIDTALETAKQAKVSQTIRERYKDKPITFHREHPTPEPSMKWPLVIRSCYAQLWLGRTTRAIIKAPRGGGKSKLLGTLGFDLWFFKNRKVMNMGGSLVQSEIVYDYFRDYTDLHEDVTDHIRGEPLRHGTNAKIGGYFSCVTASQKQVRGKHPDVLLSDETCETDDDIVQAALPTISTSENPLVVMASTFHQIFGIFQETWDNAEQLGYARFSWDIFDITKEFDPAVWDKPEIKKIDDIELLKKRARGRTGDIDGWIPFRNIIQAWREKPTLDWFDVEYMGSRPSSTGLVLNPEDVDRAVIAVANQTLYNLVTGAERIIGVDWGFSSMTSVTDWMRHKDDVKVLVDNRNYTQTKSEEIIIEVVQMVREGGHRFIYADSEAKFENAALQSALNKAKLKCTVVEVVFSTEKPEMLGNLRAHFERSKVKIPLRFRVAFWQYKRFRYKEGTDKVVKKDDHIPDSTMCAWQHTGWKLGTYIRHLSETKDEEDKGMITGGLLDEQY